MRAITLTGAGDHFCGGFDIVARNAGRGRSAPRAGSIQRRLPAQAHRLIPLLAAVQVPVVCGVRGWAAGIGLHLVLAADFAVVAEDARLWEPFSERGFTPDSGGTWLLPRRVGEARAREMLLLGRAIDGREAAGWGLAHAAVPAAGVDAEADGLAAPVRGRPDGRARPHEVAAARRRQRGPGGSAAQRGLRDRAVVARRGLQGGPDRLQGQAPPAIHRKVMSRVTSARPNSCAGPQRTGRGQIAQVGRVRRQSSPEAPGGRWRSAGRSPTPCGR